MDFSRWAGTSPTIQALCDGFMVLRLGTGGRTLAHKIVGATEAGGSGNHEGCCMKIGLSTSVIQRGKTGVAEYVFSLVRALEAHAPAHQFILFVLKKDLPLFEFAKNFARLVPVSESFRGPLKDIFWHQTILPRFAREY